MSVLDDRLSPYEATAADIGLDLFDLKAIAEERLRYITQTAQKSIDECGDRTQLETIVSALGATRRALDGAVVEPN